MQTPPVPGRLLVVDDTDAVRTALKRLLEHQGHTVEVACNGKQALALAKAGAFDLVLTDIEMPEMDGFALLEHLRREPSLQSLPVIVISALSDRSSIVRCIRLGADDYELKPFDAALIQARVDSCLEKKRSHDRELAYLKAIEAEQERAESLLLNILPKPVAERLKQTGDVIAETVVEVTVLFADIVGFTALSAQLPPEQLVDSLNLVFSTFDALVDRRGLEKIKTIGDAYMAVGGLPTPRPDHAEAVADLALDMLAACPGLQLLPGKPLELRIGISTGPVVAGVIGRKKFSYDLWGDTVNLASRMESHGLPGRIQVSRATYEKLAGRYRFEPRGVIDVKGKGPMEPFLLLGRR